MRLAIGRGCREQDPIARFPAPRRDLAAGVGALDTSPGVDRRCRQTTGSHKSHRV